MKYMSWILGVIFLIFGASCDILNPTANQVTVEVSSVYGNACSIVSSLDGNNTVTISNGTYYTFPLVNTGSHTLNFGTAGTSCSSSACKYVNNNSVTFNTTFNTVAGTIYVASVTQSGSACSALSVIGPN